MKKRWLIVLLCLVTVFGICFIGCNKKVDPVAITVSGATEGETLVDYMQDLQADGELTFTVADGMLTKLNGVANTTNSYWMLYTNDTANANTEWGTYVYEGETLGSAALGAQALTVKNGCVYVWVYTTF